jgi:RNA polymerase sigma-54 factor
MGLCIMVCLAPGGTPMFLDQRQQATPHHTQNQMANAKLIASISILQLSSLELEQSIAQEQMQNPAFDVDEVPQCLQCGSPLRENGCPICGVNSLSTTPISHESLVEMGDTYEPASLAGGGDDEEYDPMLRVSTTASLEELLINNMRMLVDIDDMPIVEALVGNLDDRGYLMASVDELADDLGIDPERVARVLAILQTQEPIGIGARDLSECLLIQLRWYREHGQPQPLAEQIAAGYLKEVGERKFVEIGRELGKTSTYIKNAWQFIKTHLNPFPAHAAVGELTSRINARSVAVLIRPDVIIRRTDNGFEAEVVESKRFRFGIQSSYSVAASHLRDGVIADIDRKHIREYVQRAQFFIDCVQQRWQTLKKISDALIEEQYDFLDRGVRYLKPLTRSELAIIVGLHEATISRATNDKYVLLPDGHTIPFDDFFDASLRAKDTLRELIATEDARHPFSDEDLAIMLTERGMPVARRTVAKYRDSLKIPPSRLR